MRESVDILEKMNLPRGFSSTNMKRVRLYKESLYSARVPLIYDPSLCFILQGQKKGFLDGYSFEYNPESYLVVSANTPMEMEITASENEPLYGISITIDQVEINNMITKINQDIVNFDLNERLIPLSLGPSKMDDNMKNCLHRLVVALQNKSDSLILEDGIIREIYYNALKGDKGYLLKQLSQQSGNYSKIINIMTYIYNNYSKKISVDNLAESANMSVSAFHRAFKSAASDSPLQYLKKVRLNKARDLLLDKKRKSYEIAQMVGYESVSQFSRDFKKFYGYNTSELKKSS